MDAIYKDDLFDMIWKGSICWGWDYGCHVVHFSQTVDLCALCLPSDRLWLFTYKFAQTMAASPLKLNTPMSFSLFCPFH
jgi:hypothetical protein